MAKEELIAGLDVGSNKVCCAVGAYNERERTIKILAGSSVISNDGIREGAVIDIQEASRAIDKVVEDVEKTVGQSVKDAVLAARGRFIKAFNSKGMASINNAAREVTDEVVYAAIESAKKNVPPEADYEILQVVPREFILNSQRGIKNPIGQEATFIEVNALAFTASTCNVKNILKAMGPLDCIDKVYGYLAASEIVVTKEEKELGCLVVDLGGHTTGITHYSEGLLRFAQEIPVGFDYITRDIMHKLRASFNVAKDVKERYGAAFGGDGFVNEEFEYLGADGKTARKYSTAQLIDVILPRVDEIICDIDEMLKKTTSFEAFLSGGIILTGGGSNLLKISNAFEKAFNCSCRAALPDAERVIGPSDVVGNPLYTTAIGAVNAGFSNDYAASSAGSGGEGVFGKIKRILEETF
jgi:cell division protein FtsA